MPIDPSDEIADDAPTEELPVLVETVVLGAGEAIAAGGQVEDTAERTASFTALTGGSTAEIEALQTDLAARGAKIATLEQDIGRLSARWNEVEQHLTARDARIEELTRTMNELRRQLADRESERQRLANELLERSAEIARLTADNEALRAAAEAARAQIEALPASRAEPPPAEASSLADLRDEIASLTAYITNRSEWWHELKARAAAADDRVRTLERALREATETSRNATALAEQESGRAAAMRAELVAATRLAEEQRREIARARNEHGATPVTGPAVESAPTAAPAPSATPNLASIDQRLANAQHAPLAAAPEAPPAPAFEVLAALEAEVAHKRQQISAQLVELRDRDQQLQAGAATIAGLQKDLAALRAELEQKRGDVGRLERALVEKDRALEARDARIGTLHQELNQRLGAIQKLNAMDVSLQGLSSKMSDRLRHAEQATEPAAPTLVCLTGDAPRQVALTKKVLTIGRGHDCDVRIVTHFVSREHARIVTEKGTVVIEDLASTNGVFVNSVRVERQELRHGDLVTVGETQFRFLESVAH